MPTITYRKLIKFGEGGAVITVPKGWIRYYGLKTGDRLEVIADGELIVRPVKKRLWREVKGLLPIIIPLIGELLRSLFRQ